MVPGWARLGAPRGFEVVGEHACGATGRQQGPAALGWPTHGQVAQAAIGDGPAPSGRRQHLSRAALCLFVCRKHTAAHPLTTCGPSGLCSHVYSRPAWQSARQTTTPEDSSNEVVVYADFVNCPYQRAVKHEARELLWQTAQFKVSRLQTPLMSSPCSSGHVPAVLSPSSPSRTRQRPTCSHMTVLLLLLQLACRKLPRDPPTPKKPLGGTFVYTLPSMTHSGGQ